MSDTSTTVHAGTFDTSLLDILICPISGGDLTFDASRQELLCTLSGLAYPVRDGIPVMLPSEARSIEPTETIADHD